MGYTLTIEVSLIHLVDVPNNYVGVIITKILLVTDATDK